MEFKVNPTELYIGEFNDLQTIEDVETIFDQLSGCNSNHSLDVHLSVNTFSRLMQMGKILYHEHHLRHKAMFNMIKSAYHIRHNMLTPYKIINKIE
jgi:hypothetical protein